MTTIYAGTNATNSYGVTADTSGNLVLQTNGGTTALTIDTSQNLGLAVTPSAWTGGPATQFKYGGSVWNNNDSSFHISENAFYNGSWNYISGTSASATNYFQSIGTHNWRYASAGTGALTWTTAMTLDASGNLGLGVTPSAWYSSYKAMQLGSGAAIQGSTNVSRMAVSANWYADSAGNDKYIGTGYASVYTQLSGAHTWYTAPSGTAGNAITFTQAMTLDASGNLQLRGTTASTWADGVTLGNGSGGFWGYSINQGSGQGALYFMTATAGGGRHAGTVGYDGTSNYMWFETGSTERARIDSSGNLLVGTTSSSARRLEVQAASNGLAARFNTNNGTGIAFFENSGTPNNSFNVAATCQYVGRDSGTSRSINAAGTINASGADYAEYMTKAGDFVVVKGDVVGINADGKLTNVFSNAVSFVVKSSDPSYVGGDVWGTPEALGLSKLEDDATDEEKATFNTALEAARQAVDRIAFAGQVPVNVTGAVAGQFIVPTNDNGAIKGEAVSNPTFEQYQQAVGKVIAIEQDGRARIIVKVA